MTDPAKALLAALRSRCRPNARLHAMRSDTTPWRSLLFDGERHILDVVLEGPDVEGALRDLRHASIEADLRLPGHLLVELSVDGSEPQEAGQMVRLRALTLEAGSALSA